MTRALPRLCTALLVCLLWACAPLQATTGSATPAGAAGPITTDLQRGHAFVAVLIDQSSPRLLASEAYGDWHSYYQQFSRRAQAQQLAVHTVEPAAGRAQLPALPRDTVNATLFVDASGRALLHRGLVLEPQVYVLGRAFIAGQALNDEMRAYGLLPLTLK
jgi:hypothetical protein